MILSKWRFSLTLRAARRSRQSREQGVAFRAIREACGLGLLEIAPLWGVEAATLAAVEDGDMSFPTAQDLQAAISQLWLWYSEKAASKP